MSKKKYFSLSVREEIKVSEVKKFLENFKDDDLVSLRFQEHEFFRGGFYEEQKEIIVSVSN